MYREDVFDLIDGLARAERRPVHSVFLNEFLGTTGVSHVAYLAFNLPTRRAARPLLSAAHTASWRTAYVQSGRIDIEPVLRAGLGGITPIDWRMLDRDDPIIRKLLGEALDLDLGVNGVSIPLRGRKGEYALFSVCFPPEASFLMSARHHLMRRLMVRSAIFHAKMRDAFEAKSDRDVRLSARELACLRLKSLAQSDEMIGLALGAGPAAARFWLEAARARLNVGTVDAALVKACRTGVIGIGAESREATAESNPVAGARSIDRHGR